MDRRHAGGDSFRASYGIRRRPNVLAIQNSFQPSWDKQLEVGCGLKMGEVPRSQDRRHGRWDLDRCARGEECAGDRPGGKKEQDLSCTWSRK